MLLQITRNSCINQLTTMLFRRTTQNACKMRSGQKIVSVAIVRKRSRQDAILIDWLSDRGTQAIKITIGNDDCYMSNLLPIMNVLKYDPCMNERKDQPVNTNLQDLKKIIFNDINLFIHFEEHFLLESAMRFSFCDVDIT